MAYDFLDRLTQAVSPSFGGNHAHRFSYDPLDNLRSWQLAGVKDFANYQYDSANRLTGIRDTANTLLHSFGYDAKGNVTAKGAQAYAFDHGNRLRAVTGVETYRYDALGRRVQTQKAGGALMLWHYAQNGQMLFSTKVDGVQTKHENVYLAGSLVAIIDHAWPSNAVLKTRYQHTDALGSPVAITDESGAVVERTVFDPYGGAVGKTVDGMGYTGHVMDGATGLTYMQQRYYDPVIGRFLSADPIATNMNTGTMFDRYAYTTNNPFKFTDPDGRRKSCPAGRSKECLFGEYEGSRSDRAESRPAANIEERRQKTEVEVPSKVGVERSGFITLREAAIDAAKVNGEKFGNRELQLGLVKLGDKNFGWATPGWGPVGATQVNPGPLLRAYEGAGLKVIAWMHSHWDSKQGFSAADYALVWERSNASFLLNNSGEVRVLNFHQLELLMDSPTMRLRDFQRAYPDGQPGEIVR